MYTVKAYRRGSKFVFKAHDFEELHTLKQMLTKKGFVAISVRRQIEPAWKAAGLKGRRIG